MTFCFKVFVCTFLQPINPTTVLVLKGPSALRLATRGSCAGSTRHPELLQGSMCGVRGLHTPDFAGHPVPFVHRASSSSVRHFWTNSQQLKQQPPQAIREFYIKLLEA